jgi:hypothetical protein
MEMWRVHDMHQHSFLHAVVAFLTNTKGECLIFLIVMIPIDWKECNAIPGAGSHSHNTWMAPACGANHGPRCHDFCFALIEVIAGIAFNEEIA